MASHLITITRVPPTQHINHHPIGFITKSQKHYYYYYCNQTRKRIVSCNSKSNWNSKEGSSSKRNNEDLGIEFAKEILKRKTEKVETEKAMKESSKLLYKDFCLYLGLGQDELKRKWVNDEMDDYDKSVLAQEFVSSDWSFHFQPLSAKSVKQLIDLHLLHHHNIKDANLSQEEEGDSSSSSSTGVLFSGLKKLMGFPSPDTTNNE